VIDDRIGRPGRLRPARSCGLPATLGGNSENVD
jgi:hypothetical protein